MAPLGIKVGATWDAPILAVRNGPAGVLVQTEGIEGMVAGADGLVSACEKAGASGQKPL
jgi:hypothetical protein